MLSYLKENFVYIGVALFIALLPFPLKAYFPDSELVKGISNVLLNVSIAILIAIFISHFIEVKHRQALDISLDLKATKIAENVFSVT